MRHFSAEDVEKVRELGFEIEEINDHGHEFEVRVRYPDSNQTLQSFKFSRTSGEDWEKEVEYVEDGEIKKVPRWKKNIKERLSEKLDAVEKKLGSEDLKKHEGEKLKV